MKLRLTILSLATAFSALIAQSTAIQFTDENGAAITMEERMATEQTKGAALVVLLDGQLILHENWGWRDAENQLPVEDETVFQVGSMSQPVAQFAIMRLVSDGILDLNTNIKEYLTNWQLPKNKITAERPVTIRDLCLQRRGFKFPYKPDGFTAGAELPTHLQLLQGEGPAKNPPVILKKDLNKNGNNSFAPALILQQILMDHYQQSFEQIAAEQVFEPLGMKNSFFASELTAEQEAKLAIGYGPNKQRINGDYRRYPELAASGLYTTAYDYALFAQALIDATAGRNTQFITQELAQETLAPSDYAETMIVNRNETNFFWGGATKGFYTQFEADAAEQRWVVVAFFNDHLNWSFNSELRAKGIELAKAKITSESAAENHSEKQ